MKETINLGVPGTFAEDELDDPNVKVEIGHVYGSFAENNARVVYNPADSTHGFWYDQSRLYAHWNSV